MLWFCAILGLGDLESLSQVRSGQVRRSSGVEAKGESGVFPCPFTFPGSQLVGASASARAMQWAFWLLPRDVTMKGAPFTRSIGRGRWWKGNGAEGGGISADFPCGNNCWRGWTRPNTFPVIFGYVFLLYFHPLLVFGSVDNASVWQRFSLSLQFPSETKGVEVISLHVRISLTERIDLKHILL